MQDIKLKFYKQLNRHGYGFQYSVLRCAKDSQSKKETPWVFAVAEFPVEVQGSGTRIDFILRLGHSRLFMLAECKRADPKFNNWCFVKAPLVRRGRSKEYCFVEHVENDSHGNCRAMQDKLFLIDKEAYHIGLPVASAGAKGESGKSGRDAIEEAATQVCRGLNGLVELTRKKTGLISTPAQNELLLAGGTFIPVIFTTAKLYTCDCDLSLANLEDGNLDVSKDELSEKDWIFYQYHLSPGIKHAARSMQEADNFADILDYEYIRTIPIVTAKGVKNFLTSFCQDQAEEIRWSKQL